MDKHIAMRTAKASQEDIDGGLDLAVILDAIGKSGYPRYSTTPKDRAAADEAANISTQFGPNAFDHLQRLHRSFADLLERRPGFSLWRVATGRDTILHNDILDSDDDCSAIHPKFAVENTQLRDTLATPIGFGDVAELRSIELAVRQVGTLMRPRPSRSTQSMYCSPPHRKRWCHVIQTREIRAFHLCGAMDDGALRVRTSGREICRRSFTASPPRISTVWIAEATQLYLRAGLSTSEIRHIHPPPIPGSPKTDTADQP